MSPETIINLKVYGTAFLISIGIMAVIWVYTGIKMKEFTAHIQKVLGPVFPDVKADGYNVSFKVYGGHRSFSVLVLQQKTANQAGGGMFRRYVRLCAGAGQNGGSDCSAARQSHSQPERDVG